MNQDQTDAQSILAGWLADGHELIGHGDGHAWYPCRYADIPRGGYVGVYHSLGGPDARRLIREGLLAGWSY